MENRQLKLEVEVGKVSKVVEYLKTLGRLDNLVIVANFKDCEKVSLYYYLEVISDAG